MNYERNQYGAYLTPPEFVRELMRDAERAGYWKTGTHWISHEGSTRGVEVRAECYGFDEHQHLAVIQLRTVKVRPRPIHSRKDFYLLGREQGQVFCRFVRAPLRSELAMSDPVSCVDYVLSRLYSVKLAEISHKP
jgi:hypothetical protein